MRSVNVEVITIGDEILIGQIVDTNSAWMAQELNKAGFELYQITSVHDNEAQIISTLDLALSRVDVVLVTGGIGPTNDDITKQTLCKYFNCKLEFNRQVLENIERLFSQRPNYTINELTYAQAMVPNDCTVIQNLVGTAPIMWFEKGNKVIVSMPGVPYEMKNAMHSELIPRLQAFYQTPAVIHKTAQVYGYGESALALKIADWESQLPKDVSLAYLPTFGVVKLRLSGVSDDALGLEFRLNQQMQTLQQLLGSAIFAFEDIAIEQLLGRILAEKQYTISTAESCTGGNIAAKISSVAGSSAYFKGSVVAYANEVKQHVLGVSKDLLDTFGAVSAEVVAQMAIGACKLMNTDVAIATSGVAGPSGGTEAKPVGTVWIAVCVKGQVQHKLYHFGVLREQNIQRATQAAMLLLKEML